MDIFFLLAALPVAVRTLTYALWLKRRGDKAAAAFALSLSLLCVALPAWRLATGP
jgi:predicted permease